MRWSAFLCVLLVAGCGGQSSGGGGAGGGDIPDAGDNPGNTPDDGTTGDTDEQYLAEIASVEETLAARLGEFESLAADGSPDTAAEEIAQRIETDANVSWARATEQGVAIEYLSGLRAALLFQSPDVTPPDSARPRARIPRTAAGPTRSSAEAGPRVAADGGEDTQALLLIPTLTEFADVYCLSDTSARPGDFVDNLRASLSAVDASATYYLDDDCTVERYTADSLKGYDVIHLESHGMLWPERDGVTCEDVYLQTGEQPDADSKEKYRNDLQAGKLVLGWHKTGAGQWQELYYVGSEFVTSGLDLSDTHTLVWLGFCNSWRGAWQQRFLESANAAACLGWNNVANLWEASSLAEQMYAALCDTTLWSPMSLGTWYDQAETTVEILLDEHDPDDPVDDEWGPVTLMTEGDPTLTLWDAEQPDRLVWRAQIGDLGYYASPTVAGGRVYVPAAPAGGTEQAGLFCFDATTGNQLWYQAAGAGGAYGSSPLIVNNTVCISEPRTALDAATGQVAWTGEDGSRQWALAFEDDLLYSVVTRTDPYLRCSDAADDTEQWESHPNPGGTFSEFAVVDGRIYCSVGRSVWCLDPKYGSAELEWSFRADGEVTEPAVLNNTIYVGSRVSFEGGRAELIALAAADGELEWRRELDMGLSGTLAVADGRIYARTMDGELAVFTIDGDLLWQTTQSISSRFTTRQHFAVTAGYVYATGIARTLQCLDAATGDLVFEFDPDPDTLEDLGAPVVADGQVYFLGEGQLYCIRAAEGDGGSWPMFRLDPARTAAR